jgi:hypothetical protein
MANEEHLKILKQGVEAWNRWREENPEVQPNISGSDLRGSDLREANLHGSNLSFADLRRANLHGADLCGTNLRGSDLSGANLSGVYLIGADLREVHLNWANLGSVYLKGADLSGARLEYTSFSNTDLSEAEGLDTIKHIGPSFIDIHTIYRSHGEIPEAFLRGCGVPDAFIDYVASLIHEAIQYYSCFISYSTKDEPFAQYLYADLQDKGVRCWFAPEDMKIGDEIRPRIVQSIRMHDKLLVVLSEHSIGSDWVEDEVETAIEEERKRKETVLFPIRLDEAVMETNEAWAAKIRRTRHIGDFSPWEDHDSYQGAFDRLLRDLRAEE